jgi:hypothetical protein
MRGGDFMSATIEEKFDYLAELVISAAERYNPLAMEKKNEVNFIKAIQIILTTSTTILLGLKLGGIATSVAFVFSTLATAFTVWYNIENNSKLYSSMYKYSTCLISLAREIQFYRQCTNPMEEEKFEEYSRRFFNIKEEFEKESISLTEESLKKDQDAIKALKAK